MNRRKPSASPIGSLLDVWQINNKINLLLLEHLDRKALSAVPYGSRGRSVSAQFAHLHKVRVGWIDYNSPEFARGIPRFGKAAAPTRRQLASALRASGRAVEAYLKRKLETEGTVKFFKRSPIRWLAYMIAHESHHRGQIALALKQNGRRLPEKVALGVVWYTWYSGKTVYLQGRWR